VIREGRVALLGIDYAGPPPLGWFFIAFTALVPLAYIVQGLRRADRMLLVLGLLAVGFSVFTLRFYRSLMPAPLAATLAGAVLSAGAGAALRYLRPGRHGLTSTPDAAEEPAPDDAANPLSPANLEALVTAHANPAAAPAPAPGLEFGGGQFGGGGASSNY